MSIIPFFLLPKKILEPLVYPNVSAYQTNFLFKNINPFQKMRSYKQPKTKQPTKTEQQQLTIIDFLHYEIKGHWLAPKIKLAWLNKLFGKYFAWKVKRKFGRYLARI